MSITKRSSKFGANHFKGTSHVPITNILFLKMLSVFETFVNKVV